MKLRITLFLALFLGSFVFSAQSAIASTPFYSATFDSSANALRINVSGANSFSQIDFFGRQGGDVWTQITNVGRTDQFGSFNGLVYPGLNFYSGNVETYVVVNGQQSSVITLSPFGCFNFNNCNNSVLASSTTTVSLNVSNSATVNFFPRNNTGLMITNFPDSSIASASLNGNSLNIFANRSGNTSVRVCNNFQTECAAIFISVSGFGGPQLTFSRNDIFMQIGENATVSVSNSFSNSFLSISSNSNPDAVTASISGGIVNLRANNSGSAVIVVCPQNFTANCGNLRVNVGNFNSGGLFFLNTSLPTAFVVQSYFAQLQVNGGTTPYSFMLWQGTLPVGMFLNSNGTITGTPQTSQTVSFIIRVADNFGRSALQNFSLTVSGSVLGATTYANGSLIKEGNTISEVYKNTKSGFTNFAAFSGLGFKLENVTDVGVSGLPDSGHIFSTAQTAHPWGTWTKSGSTVYFMHEAGLIPVPSYDIFLNNGGQDRLVVLTNTFDFQRPLLSFMISSDPRLK